MIKECFVAELKMYEKGRGVEVSNPMSLDVIYKDEEGNYRNVFNPDESYTTLSRVKHLQNYYYTESGEEIAFGSKMKLLSEKEETGPCWVLTGTSFQNVKREDLENMIINSSDYFKDRANIIMRRFGRFNLSILKERRQMEEDLFSFNNLVEFFRERGIEEFDDYHFERPRKKRVI